MDNIIRLSNLVTVGNIGTAVTLVGAIIFGYWKLKKYWFDRQQDFLRHIERTLNAQTQQVQEKLDAQTAHIESCIHQVPGHPEGKI